jgi:GWxTD domain-containing protein
VTRWVFGVALLAAAAPLPPAVAQRPPGADTISIEAVDESLAVLRRIDAQLKREPRSAELWYRRGMLAWALYDRDRVQSGVHAVDWTLIGRIADTSLRIAKEIEPTNPRYVLSAGQYFLGTGLMTMRTQSAAMFGEALTLARAADNRALHAEAALEVGRVYWRRYDAVANAGYSTTDPAEVRALAEALARDTVRRGRGYDPERATKSRPFTRRTVSIARRTLDRSNGELATGFPGETDYLEADRYMREAYETLPTYTRAYQQLSMLLAERGRWSELETLARSRADVAADEPWTWMTLGLALYRQGDVDQSRAAFGRGLGLMRAEDRERLDHLERVLRPADTLTTAEWSAEERRRRSDRYWIDADPLWSAAHVDPRAEFLARIAFAELRWSVAELIKRGTDTDRGAVYVRYGPADRIATDRGDTEWTYDFYRLRFRFNGAPTFGTAYFGDYGRARRTMDSLPALWDNTHLLQIDSLLVQPARFRAGGDSIDVFLATQAPLDAIRRASDVVAPVTGHYWIIDSTSAVQRHDSTRALTPGVTSITHRVRAGNWTFRFETGAEGSLVAARSVTRLELGTASDFTVGFGISDILLATRIADRSGTPARWRDVPVTPLVGPMATGSQIGLVWENYELGARDGSATYRVVVTLQREQTRAGRIAAQVVRALGGAVGRDALADKVVFSYDRTAAHAPVIVDEMTISLGGSPAGSYFLTVDVLDVVTGRTTSRTTRIVVAD